MLQEVGVSPLRQSWALPQDHSCHIVKGTLVLCIQEVGGAKPLPLQKVKENLMKNRQRLIHLPYLALKCHWNPLRVAEIHQHIHQVKVREDTIDTLCTTQGDSALQ